MKRLQHLTSIERDKITILQGEGLSIRKIAKELGRSPSTISRELNRPELYLKLLQQLEEIKNKTEICIKIAEDELKEKGYEIVKIPCFSVVGNNSNPINYMNGICGTSAKTGDKFYITNTSGDEALDAYMENYFKEVVGFDKVYFAPTKKYLNAKGGIDCLTKEF